jgi:Spy/CpxP family protein refolding chaperone
LVFIALLAGASIASGCSGCDKQGDSAVDAAPATSATPASSSAAVVASDATAPEGGTEEGGRRGAHRGPSGMLFSAARSLGLPADQQKKIDDADKIVPPHGDPAAKDAAKELHTELIAGIKAGKIDTAKLEPKYAALDKIASAEHDKEAESLNALYAALDGTQRKAVVSSVRATQAKREERMFRKEKEHGDGGAHDGGKAAGGKRNVERLTRGLDLDAEQQKKVDALAPKEEPKGGPFDYAEMKKRTEALLAAFEKDGFDAKKVEAFDAKKHRGALEEETKLLSQLLPILKPEQREKLAAKMEKGPSPHGGKRPGMGHRPLTEPEEDDFAP